MIRLSLAEIAHAVGGSLHRASGGETVTGAVEFDSRSIGAGDLFVALPGESADGHRFAADAVVAGAAGVLAARPVDAPAVLVGSTDDAAGAAAGAVLAALARLARAVLDRLAASQDGGPAVVGITGSSGKTTTKDMTTALLTPLGSTVGAPGSFNNELGHPWTVLRAEPGTRHLVLELSARGPGHIAALCRTAPPSVGVVLNVGSAHLGEFGSRAAVAAAKGELVEHLPVTGTAVLSADDPVVSAMDARTGARVCRVGSAPDADVRATDIRLDDSGRAAFRLDSPWGSTQVRLAVHGAHQVGNALAAAAVACVHGASPELVAEVLAEHRPASPWRMDVTSRSDGVTVVNDAYNANPESVAAALRTLVSMSGPGRRSWAVLGGLAELGDSEVTAHAEVGELAMQLGVDRLVVVGQQARPMHRAALSQRPDGSASVHVDDAGDALALLRSELAAGDVVLVKASRAARLERIAHGLLHGEDAS